MAKRFYILAAVVAFIAISGLQFVASETAVSKHGNDEHPRVLRYLENTQQTPDKTEGEERGMGRVNAVSRLKNLFRSDKNKLKGVKPNKRSAAEAFTKVKALVGFSRKPTKVTPTQVKNLETYAHSNPDKWDAMTYYLDYVYGITLVLFMAGGALYFGWRY
ncbi:RxLR effector protein [Phytophthora megakarya]|uniref:RxLR effector protein n=1 Tax=Phytophthora megakarya TaxID=4795 RepID=A0A225WUU0_9STRA|nr:RxLR effector protein [Phytophthora megakarya]